MDTFILGLILEHVFYEYSEPILFVCRDHDWNRYLCSCCKLSEEWVLSKVSVSDLLSLVDNKITIRSLFEGNRQDLLVLLWDGQSIYLSQDDRIIQESLPDDELLEATKNNFEAYRKALAERAGLA